MGYRVNSLLSVSVEDGHGAFVYFVPSGRLEFDWINRWVDNHFDVLAAKLGPRAVLITPPAVDREAWDEDEAGLQFQHAIHQSLRLGDKRARDFGGHTGLLHHEAPPVLVLTQRPFRWEPAVADEPRAEPWQNRTYEEFLKHERTVEGVGPVGDAVAVNLAAYDEPGLARLFDGLVDALHRGADVLEALPAVPSDDRAFGDMALRVVELKPNFFGMGVNLNAVATLVRDWRRRRHGQPELRGDEFEA